jgi:hypothetical protein
MVTINYAGESFELRNEAKEVRLSEFNKIHNILSLDKTGHFEKYTEVFKVLGVPEDVIDGMSIEEFVELVKMFNDISQTKENPVQSFEIDGYTYTAYTGEKFEFTAKDLVMLERGFKQGVGSVPAFVLAVIFKREDLTKKEHFDTAHINHKAKLFSEHLFMDVALPYLGLVSQRVIKQVENA